VLSETHEKPTGNQGTTLGKEKNLMTSVGIEPAWQTVSRCATNADCRVADWQGK